MAEDEEDVRCPLPLAFLPDGALGLVLSFGTVSDLIASNMVCAVAPCSRTLAYGSCIYLL